MLINEYQNDKKCGCSLKNIAYSTNLLILICNSIIIYKLFYFAEYKVLDQ